MAKKACYPRLIGVIHLPPLAGSPRADKHPAESLQEAGQKAIEEAVAYESAGFEAIVLENFGDEPFYKEKVPDETLASVAVVSAAVREATELPLGLNFLRNDCMAAMSCASVTGAEFIRVNVLSGVVATDQGWIEGRAAELLRLRKNLGADVRIFADVHVKHGRNISSPDIGMAIEETALRAGADAVIVTGSGTGKQVSFPELRRAAEVSRQVQVPLFVGSGCNPENAADILKLAEGVIVGSYVRKGGRAGAPLDPKRMMELAQVVHGAGASGSKKKTSKKKKSKGKSKSKK